MTQSSIHCKELSHHKYRLIHRRVSWPPSAVEFSIWGVPMIWFSVSSCAWWNEKNILSTGMSHHEIVFKWFYTFCYTNNWFDTLGEGTCEFAFVDNCYTLNKCKIWANLHYNPSPIYFRPTLIGYFTSCGAKSADSYHAITAVWVNICPPVVCHVSVQKKLSRRKKFNLKLHFSSLLTNWHTSRPNGFIHLIVLITRKQLQRAFSTYFNDLPALI